MTAAKNDGGRAQAQNQSEQKADRRHERQADGCAHAKPCCPRCIAVKEKCEQRTAENRDEK